MILKKNRVRIGYCQKLSGRVSGTRQALFPRYRDSSEFGRITLTKCTNGLKSHNHHRPLLHAASSQGESHQSLETYKVMQSNLQCIVLMHLLMHAVLSAFSDAFLPCAFCDAFCPLSFALHLLIIGMLGYYWDGSSLGPTSPSLTPLGVGQAGLGWVPIKQVRTHHKAKVDVIGQDH